MSLQMGFQDVAGGHLRTRYERLTGAAAGEKAVARGPRRRWVMKMKGRLKGFRLPRSRKLNWKAFSLVLFPRRIAGIYADVVNRFMKMEGICPTIVFSCQWGLPVLSHSTVKCRKSAMYSDRNLTCLL